MQGSCNRFFNPLSVCVEISEGRSNLVAYGGADRDSSYIHLLGSCRCCFEGYRVLGQENLGKHHQGPWGRNNLRRRHWVPPLYRHQEFGSGSRSDVLLSCCLIALTALHRVTLAAAEDHTSPLASVSPNLPRFQPVLSLC